MKRILILTAIFCFTAASAYAGSVETFGIGAKETAQGKAVAAQADTPFAVYYNPAGLTQIEGPTLSAGSVFYEAEVSSKLKVIDPNTGKEINNGWDNDNETDNDTLVNPALGYAMPITDNISFGVAAYSPYGLTLESNKNPYENPISFFAWESHYVRMAVTPTIAYKFSDKLSFGFGVSLGQSECNAGRTYKANPFKMKVLEIAVEKGI
ncbi:MAG: outer membrane protein transport protein, partial [Desulforegulaceae bacterium]|nr:outer membrane protein transport protein [Desulforegulaceae bacterium]